MTPKKKLPDQQSRKPYEKPAVVHRAILEAIAGACAKYPEPVNGKVGTGDNCTLLYS
jgi:hypothetical protein